VQLLLERCPSTEEEVFIVEYYFRRYASGREEPSLKKVTEQFRERFNKTAPSNTVMPSIVTKFRRFGSVLCQRKGKSGRPVTVSTKENYARVLQGVLHSSRRTALKLNVSDTSVRRLLKDIGGFPYWIPVGQRLTEPDIIIIYLFNCNWVLARWQ
jgi:hypothetical protein